MLTQFFALYPQQGEKHTIEMRLLGYISELSDIHPEVIARALRRLVRDAKRGNFLPSVAEIRRSAAYVIRAVRGGRDPSAPEDRELPDINVERYLEVGPKPGEPWLQLVAGEPRKALGA